MSGCTIPVATAPTMFQQAHGGSEHPQHEAGRGVEPVIRIGPPMARAAFGYFCLELRHVSRSSFSSASFSWDVTSVIELGDSLHGCDGNVVKLRL